MLIARSVHITRNISLRRCLSAKVASGAGESNQILLKSRKNGVLTLTMNSPKNLNAWSIQMLTELLNGLKEAETDKDVKVIDISGV